MADIEHSALTDTDGLHEPKGAGLLVNGTVDQGKIYTSDGAGSGTWATPSEHYGQMNIIANTISQTLGVGVSEQLIGDDATGKWVSGLVNGITFNAADQALVVADSGTYVLDFWCSFTAPNNSDTTFLFSIDGGTTLSTQTMTRTSTASTDVGVISARSLITLTPASIVEIHVKNTVGGSLSFEDSGMTLLQVSGV